MLHTPRWSVTYNGITGAAKRPHRFRPMRHPIIRHAKPAVDTFKGIVEVIENAKRSGLKRIVLRFQRFQVKPSKYDGKCYVFSYDTEVNQWGTLSPVYLGWVTKDQTSLADADLVSELKLVASDPLSAAQLYAQETGNCSCCGRTLTVEESIRLGIGPICRAKFGL